MQKRQVAEANGRAVIPECILTAGVCTYSLSQKGYLAFGFFGDFRTSLYEVSRGVTVSSADERGGFVMRSHGATDWAADGRFRVTGIELEDFDNGGSNNVEQIDDGSSPAASTKSLSLRSGIHRAKQKLIPSVLWNPRGRDRKTHGEMFLHPSSHPSPLSTR
ncbi:hypothetical protein Bbelb_321200 [Branchiostoma belcheri]|nr:hypothetical protein Bbelb_321200 [Branchiostoma belcheri]